MLASAVQKNKTAQQEAQSRSLGQQIFSSSPLQIQRPGAGTLARVGDRESKTLKSSSPNKINGTTSYAIPLKRSSSTMSSGSSGATAARSFSHQSKHQASHTALPRTNSGLLAKLHQEFEFDENDFCDDADINLDEPFPETYGTQLQAAVVEYPSLPAYSKKEPEYPSLPEPVQRTPSNKPPHSSAPIPWSSSPLSHMLPPKAVPSRRPQDPPTSRPLSKPTPREVINLDAEEAERPAKRRTLPWLDKASTAKLDIVESGSKRMQRPKKEPSMEEELTPVRKFNGGSYLWNVTASAVKAEQKRHRLENSGPGVGKNKSHNVEGEDGASANLRKVKTAKKSISPVFLSDEQQRVLKLVVDDKKSVFFTGSAGTGKSVLMREIIAKLRKKYKGEGDRVAVTASTGLAACNIGGNTLHSFAGIGLGKESVEVLCKKIRRNPKTAQRWQRTKILVIDEVSMIDGELFDKLEAIARNIRKKAAPFGGIQLVITGDFFQLPPVGGNGQSAKFSFDAATWNTCIDHTIGLTHVFRQKDPVFAGMLNEMRLGKLSPDSIRAFQKLSRPLDGRNETVEATELFSTRNEVEQANQMRLRKLGGNAVEFRAQDGGTLQDGQQRDKLLANCMAPSMMTLKKGAQVMLIKNIDETLVNGSIGKVIAFMDEKTFDYYDDNEEEFLSTQPSMDVESGGPSAKKSLKGFMNPGAGVVQSWPVVRFQIADGTSRDLLCQRETWKIEQPNGEVLASRAQIPLILAWALSIHKAQGQTLEKVKVDLRRVFEKGQAYVALSRATTQAGLQVTGFDARKVQAHERVRKFYDSLYGVETIAGTTMAPAGPQDRVKTNMYKDEFPFGPDEEDFLAQLPI